MSGKARRQHRSLFELGLIPRRTDLADANLFRACGQEIARHIVVIS